MNAGCYLDETIKEIREKISETEFVLSECFMEENAKNALEKYVEDYKRLLAKLEEIDF